ncbi:hypothetical protein E2562_030862 [Oryza meyeriana var. granulata]|uniref:Uncharacterized protein n=1 Tax=Oryza meyeriana var. granulata TaxID=110450 RepID=A0A6G1EZY7_9ORYZ|nr:hypothetical protein E2562_030862 [Oryza meyeriana var. granulata]
MRILRQVTPGAFMSTYTAPSSAVVERLMPHTGATEEDPASAGEVTPASVMRPTIEDDTTTAAKVSSTAFADVDEAAG